MDRPLFLIACCAAALLLLPTVQADEKEEALPPDAKGETAAFIRSRNSLKQLMGAMHLHYNAHLRLPAAYTRKEDGTKLLSWRVKLLPYLGEGALYAQFHLDEPWDSDHNKKLIPKIPPVFACPALGDEAAKKGLTRFVGPVAPKTIFEGSEAIPLSKIRDGTSNTLGFLEADAEHAVIWTKPDDIKVDWKEPLKGVKLWKIESGSVFLTVFCDGKVQAVSEKIDGDNLRRLMQKNDGEVIGIIP